MPPVTVRAQPVRGRGRQLHIPGRETSFVGRDKQASVSWNDFKVTKLEYMVIFFFVN